MNFPSARDCNCDVVVRGCKDWCHAACADTRNILLPPLIHMGASNLSLVLRHCWARARRGSGETAWAGLFCLSIYFFACRIDSQSALQKSCLRVRCQEVR